MSNDAKLVIAGAAIVCAIFGAAWVVSTVMIEVTVGVREDLRDLRDSLERAACGELARQGNVAVTAGAARPACGK